MATRMAMMTMTMRSSMMVKAGVSLVDSLLVDLAGALEAVLLCLILVLFIGLILT